MNTIDLRIMNRKQGTNTILVVIITALISVGIYFILTKQLAPPETIPTPIPTPPAAPPEPTLVSPSDNFPSIEIEAGRSVDRGIPNLTLSAREIFTSSRIGPILQLALGNPSRIYMNSCYGLAGGSQIVDDKIFVLIEGTTYFEGRPCLQAPHPLSTFTVTIPDINESYLLLIKYPDPDLRTPSIYQIDKYTYQIDKYTVTVNQNKIKFAPEGDQRRTTLSAEEFLRIPANIMWVEIGYLNRDKFASRKKEFIDSLISLGAKELIGYIPKQGKYAYGGGTSWPTADQISSSPNSDFLFFMFTGDFSAVRNLVSKFTEYKCEVGKNDCMNITVWSWQGGKTIDSRWKIMQ